MTIMRWLQCLSNVLQSLEAWTRKGGYGLTGPAVTESNDRRASRFEAFIEGVTVDESEPTDETQALDFEKAKARKVSLEAAVIEVSF